MANINTAITPAPVVTCFTKGGQVASAFNGDVTASLAVNPTGATLTGTPTVTAVNGVATFSNLRLTRSGKNFRIGAAATDVRAATSAAFSIPTTLTFTIQPHSVAASGDILPPFQVTSKDSAGNTDTSYNGEVTISLYRGAGDGILGGFTTRLAISGVVDFSGISVDEVDGAKTFSLKAEGTEVFTAYKPAAKVSNTFAVGGTHTLTAASMPNLPDWNAYGFIDGTDGAISPTTVNGATINDLYSQVKISPSPFNGTEININGALAQDFFESITYGSTTLLTSNATYQSGSTTSWQWPDEILFPSAGSYLVTIA